MTTTTSKGNDMMSNRYNELNRMVDVMVAFYDGTVTVTEYDREVCGLTGLERQRVVMAADHKYRMLLQARAAEANATGLGVAR